MILNPYRIKCEVTIPGFHYIGMCETPTTYYYERGYPMLYEIDIPARKYTGYVYNTTTGSSNVPVFSSDPFAAPELNWDLETPDETTYWTLSLAFLTAVGKASLSGTVGQITRGLLRVNTPKKRFRRWIEARDQEVRNVNGWGTHTVSGRVRYGHFATLEYGQSLAYGYYGANSNVVAIEQWATKKQFKDGQRAFYSYYNPSGSGTGQSCKTEDFAEGDTYWWEVISTTMAPSPYKLFDDLNSRVDSGIPYEPRTGPLTGYLKTFGYLYAGGAWYPVKPYNGGVNNVSCARPYYVKGYNSSVVSASSSSDNKSWDIGHVVIEIRPNYEDEDPLSQTGTTSFRISPNRLYSNSGSRIYDAIQPEATSFTWDELGWSDTFPTQVLFTRYSSAWSPEPLPMDIQYTILSRYDITTPGSEVVYDHTTGTYSTPYHTVQATLATSGEISNVLEHYEEYASQGNNKDLPHWPIASISSTGFAAGIVFYNTPSIIEVILGPEAYSYSNGMTQWKVYDPDSEDFLNLWHQFEQVDEETNDYDIEATAGGSATGYLTRTIDYSETNEFEIVFDLSFDVGYATRISQSIQVHIKTFPVTAEDY